MIIYHIIAEGKAKLVHLCCAWMQLLPKCCGIIMTYYTKQPVCALAEALYSVYVIQIGNWKLKNWLFKRTYNYTATLAKIKQGMYRRYRYTMCKSFHSIHTVGAMREKLVKISVTSVLSCYWRTRSKKVGLQQTTVKNHVQSPQQDNSTQTVSHFHICWPAFSLMKTITLVFLKNRL